MKASIDDEGHLKIEVGSIIESMSESDLRTFAKYAVFQQHLLRGVVDALVHGSMWRDDEEPAWWFGGDTFNELRLRVLALLPEIALEAVRHCEAEMRRARRERDAYRTACWALEQNWPEGRREPPKWDPYITPLTKTEAAAYIRAVDGQPRDKGEK
jgi:hypothetical protein